MEADRPSTRFLYALLPTPIQHHILDLLPSFEQGTLNSVCKATHTLFSSTAKKLIIHPSSIQHPLPPHTCPAATHLSNVTHLSIRYPDHHNLARYQNSCKSHPAVTPSACIQFLSWFTTRYSAVLPHLEELEFHHRFRDDGRIVAPALERLLQQCTRLRKLSVSSVAIHCHRRHAEDTNNDDGTGYIVDLVLQERAAGEGLKHLPGLLQGGSMKLAPMLASQACHSNRFSIVTPRDMVSWTVPQTELHDGAVWCLGQHAASACSSHPCTLQELRLQSWHNTTIPQLIPSLSQVTNLTRLVICPFQGCGLGAVIGSVLTSLRKLDCTAWSLDLNGRPSLCDLPSLPVPSWTHLRHLDTLRLGRDPHLGPSSPLWQLTALTALSLTCLSDLHDSTQHTALAGGAGITNLRSLACLSIRSDGNLTQWFECTLPALPTTLTKLELKASGCLVNPFNPTSFLTRLTNLRSLCYDCNLGPQGGLDDLQAVCSSLLSLQSLSLTLRSSSIGDAHCVSALTHLTLLHLSLQPRLPPASLLDGICWPWENCGEAASRLKVLRLNHFSGLPTVFPSSLTELTFHECSFVDDGPVALPNALSACSELQLLKACYVHTQPLSDISAVSSLVNLQSLCLVRLSDGLDVSFVDQLTRLTKVILAAQRSGYQLHGEWPRLRAMGRLKEVCFDRFSSNALPVEERTLTGAPWWVDYNI